MLYCSVYQRNKCFKALEGVFVDLYTYCVYDCHNPSRFVEHFFGNDGFMRSLVYLPGITDFPDISDIFYDEYDIWPFEPNTAILFCIIFDFMDLVV